MSGGGSKQQEEERARAREREGERERERASGRTSDREDIAVAVKRQSSTVILFHFLPCLLGSVVADAARLAGERRDRTLRRVDLS